jgi:diguanylate cyclase (GGDEF)-like protein
VSKSPTSSSIEAPLNWRIVLGLVEPEGNSWARVRAAQLGSLLRALPLIIVVQIVNASTLAWLLWRGELPFGGALWLAGLILLLLSAAALRGAALPLMPVAIGPGAMRRAALHAMLLGLLWSVPPLFFSADLTEQQRTALYLISYAMMTSGTLSASTIPQVALLYIAANAIGVTAMVATYGDPLLALLPLTYALALMLCAVLNSHAFIKRKCAEIALEEKGELVSLLLREFEEGGADWLWQVDSAKQLIAVSSRLARAAGSTPAELEGTSLLRLFAGDDWESGTLSPEVKELFERLQRRESFKDLVIPISVAGETRWWSLSAAPKYDEKRRFIGFRGVGSDQTEQRRSVARIDEMARLDSLTGLFNRREITNALRNALAVAQRDRRRCALMLIDLDRFKAVNDTLGHPVGDRLLKMVAERMRAQLVSNELGGRLGGDEFVVVLPALTDPARLDQLGAALVASLSTPFQIDGHLISIGASVGTAIGPRDGNTIETLLRHADMALYQAKKDGRGLHRRYEPGMLSGADRRRMREGALREALDRGSLELCYVAAATAEGAVEQFSVAVGLDEPGSGKLTHGELIMLAEGAQLSGRLMEWLLRQACSAAAPWGDARLFIDIPRSQIISSQFASLLLSALSHSGLAPDRLELGVDELLMAERPEEIIAGIERLRALGVRVALDRFGTGSCSLTLLRAVYFHTLRLDRSLVEKAEAGDRERIALMNAAIGMASALRIDITARDIRTPDHARRAFAAGCGLVEGLVNGDPADAAAVTARLAEAERVAA